MKAAPEFLGLPQAQVFARLEADGWSPLSDDGFLGLVGPLWQRGEAMPEFGFLAEPRHHNRGGVLQGGMMATLADIALARTARADDPSRRQATAGLEIQFLEAVQIGDFPVARCEPLRRTRSLIFVRGIISVGERPVAAASGIWKILD